MAHDMASKEQQLVIAIRMWQANRNNSDPFALRRYGQDLSDAATTLLQALTPAAPLTE